MPALWSKEEDQTLIENYGKVSTKDLMALLPRRTKESILKHIRKLDLRFRNDYWSQKEDQILIEKYGKISIHKLLKLFSTRTIPSIFNRAYRLGLKSSKNYWKPEEDQILIENYYKLSIDDLMVLLPNRNKIAIQNRASLLNICQVNGWTSKELKYLKENYGVISNKELSVYFNRSVGSIVRKAREIGATRIVKRPIWLIEEDKIVKTNYGKIPLKKLATLLPRHTIPSIQKRAKKFKCIKSRNFWMKHEITIIKENIKKPIMEIWSLLPNRSWVSVRHKIQEIKRTN